VFTRGRFHTCVGVPIRQKQGGHAGGNWPAFTPIPSESSPESARLVALDFSNALPAIHHVSFPFSFGWPILKVVQTEFCLRCNKESAARKPARRPFKRLSDHVCLAALAGRWQHLRNPCGEVQPKASAPTFPHFLRFLLPRTHVQPSQSPWIFESLFFFADMCMVRLTTSRPHGDFLIMKWEAAQTLLFFFSQRSSQRRLFRTSKRSHNHQVINFGASARLHERDHRSNYPQFFFPFRNSSGRAASGSRPFFSRVDPFLACHPCLHGDDKN